MPGKCTKWSIRQLKRPHRSKKQAQRSHCCRAPRATPGVATRVLHTVHAKSEKKKCVHRMQVKRCRTHTAEWEKDTEMGVHTYFSAKIIEITFYCEGSSQHFLLSHEHAVLFCRNHRKLLLALKMSQVVSLLVLAAQCRGTCQNGQDRHNNPQHCCRLDTKQERSSAHMSMHTQLQNCACIVLTNFVCFMPNICLHI